MKRTHACIHKDYYTMPHTHSLEGPFTHIKLQNPLKKNKKNALKELVDVGGIVRLQLLVPARRQPRRSVVVFVFVFCAVLGQLFGQ